MQQGAALDLLFRDPSHVCVKGTEAPEIGG